MENSRKRYLKKLLILLTSVVCALCLGILSSCDWFEEEPIQKKTDDEEEVCEHVWVDQIENNISATCAEEGRKAYVCSLCGEQKFEVLPKTTQHYYANNVCTVCGAKAPALETYTSKGVTCLLYTASGYITDETEREYTVVLTGSGEMNNQVPWSQYRSKIRTLTIEGNNIGICDEAFLDDEALTSVIVTGSISSIGARAFKNCTQLSSFELSSATTSIGKEAFFGCSHFTDFVLPSSITYLGEGAFGDCRRLKTITLPFVGTEDFSGKNVTLGSLFSQGSEEEHNQTYIDPATEAHSYFIIPENLTTITVIGNKTILPYAFGLYDNPLYHLYLSSDITEISSHAFYQNTGLKYIHYGTAEKAGKSKIASIGTFAFYGCTALYDFSLPKEVTVIKTNSFSGCQSLTNFYFENDSLLTSIESTAFYGDTCLEKLWLPAQTESLDNEALSHTGITELYLPSSLAQIGYGAFSSCTKLECIYIDNQTVANLMTNDSNLFDRGTQLELYIPAEVIPSTLSYIVKNQYIKLSSVPTVTNGKEFFLWQK